jgi:2-dehydropantoate 2-reductase
MRIAVVGTGVVGGYLGGKLAHAGVDVVFIARGVTLRALRDHGLRVDSVEGNFVVAHPQATDDPADLGPVDVVLLPVKGWQALEAIDTIRPLMGDDTFVVPLCDGIEVLDQLSDAFGKTRVVGGIAVMLGTSTAPGQIRNYLATSLTFGELDGSRSERVVQLQQTCARAGVTAEISDDIVSDRWRKLMRVGPWSAIGAVTRAPLGLVLTMPETRQLLEDTIREVLTLAQRRGANLSNDTVSQTLSWLGEAPDWAVGNMRDVIEGKPSELETEVGAIVRAGHESGVDIPRHEFLYASLLPLERKARAEFEFAV